jgi:hydrogenase/urease accessory protein HupE
VVNIYERLTPSQKERMGNCALLLILDIMLEYHLSNNFNHMAIIAILFLATFVEGLVEYLFGKVEKMKPVLSYIALFLGVALAVAYKVDIPAMLGLASDFGIVNFIVSGLIIGRGSNYANDIITSFQPKEDQV